MAEDTKPVAKGFFDVLDEVEAESRGGGYWCQFESMFGYRFFVKPDAGIAQKDTFFPCDLMDKASREAALKQVKARIVELGLENTRPNFCACFRVIADTVVGRTMEGEDVYMMVDTYKPGYEALTKPKLQEFDLQPGLYWGHVGWMNYEYDVPATATKSASTKTDKFIAVPDNVFASKEDMLRAANLKENENGSAPKKTSGDESIPEGFDSASWAMATEDFKKLAAKGKSYAEIASMYGIALSFVANVLSK